MLTALCAQGDRVRARAQYLSYFLLTPALSQVTDRQLAIPAGQEEFLSTSVHFFYKTCLAFDICFFDVEYENFQMDGGSMSILKVLLSFITKDWWVSRSYASHPHSSCGFQAYIHRE